MPISSCHSLSPQSVRAVHAASGKWSGCSHLYASFHSGSKCSRGWVSPSRRRHAAISAETASTHSGDKMKPGTTTRARLLHRRRSSVIRHTINSNSTNTICGCLLSAQSVIHSERSQTGPYRWTALKQRAVITRAIWARLGALARSEEHTSELQSLTNLVCRLLLEKKKTLTLIETLSHL